MSGLSFADLKTDLYDALGVSSDDIDDIKITRLLNRAYWELVDKVKFRESSKEAEITITTGGNRYPLSAFLTDFDAIKHMSYRDLLNDTQWTIMKQVDYSSIMDIENASSSTQGAPAYYARDGKDIIFYPFPDKYYLVKFLYRQSLADLSASNSPDIPRSWHEIILLGAEWRAWKMLGNSNKAQSAFNMQTALVNSAIETETKEQADNTYASASILRARYP